jgi:hypothetical protein
MRVVAGIGIALIFIRQPPALPLRPLFFVGSSFNYHLEIYDEGNVKAARIAAVLRLANVILNGDWSTCACTGSSSADRN